MINKIIKTISLVFFGIIAISAIVMFLSSWHDVEPGSEGFVYKKYGPSKGVDTLSVYREGTHFIAPWNRMITYVVRQQSKEYLSEVMDKNGTDIKVAVSVNFSPVRNKSANLDLMHGPGYIKFIDDKTRGAIREVIGRYTYEEVYSTKREELEREIESILKEDFSGNYLSMNYVEIADINLPKQISDEITAKERQKQSNIRTALMKIEEINLAEARIEKAKGDESITISAEYQADAIRKVAQELSRNPEYTEYIKWKGFSDGKGSPYGEGNVFGSGTSVVKGLK